MKQYLKHIPIRQSTSFDRTNSASVSNEELPGKSDEGNAIFGWEAAPPEEDAPPEYDSRGVNGPIAPRGVGSLKKIQTEKLKDEINWSGGVKVKKIEIVYYIFAVL